MKQYLDRAKKIMDQLNELAAISEDDTCITRIYGTKEFISGRNKVEQWMKQAGLQTRVDTIGNIRGRLVSKKAGAKTFVIASHIDTIINAGRFDGPMGVLMGLDLIQQLIESKTELPFHIELIGFCDEEGCRFHTTYLGSKAVAGSFDTALLDTKDTAGISLLDVMQLNGADSKKISEDAIAKNDWLGYYEIHIEQGPVLYEKNVPAGIVTAIAGQRRTGIVFKGEAGHAGTVPMDMRKDALTCTAEFIVEAERFALDNKTNLVCTVGKLLIPHSATNVIPGEVMVSLDTRSADEKILSSSYEQLKAIAKQIAAKRHITMSWELIQQTKPVLCDATMNQLLTRSIQEAGYEVVEMVSGAGHDAVPISAVSPVAMLFVRCFKGISHNPLEDVELKDMAAALKVSDNFIGSLIGANND
jgi:allantoate deiminase